MIEERLMAPGRWGLTLREDTPYSVRRLMGIGTNIIVTPAPVDRSLQDSDTLLGFARYTGVVLTLGRRSVSGAGLLFYLGTNDMGQVVNPTGWVDANLDFAEWIENIMRFEGVSFFDVPNSPYVEGTIQDFDATTYEFRVGGQLRKALLDLICSVYGAEYRVNADNTFDAGNDLFVTDPTVVAMPKAGVPDLDFDTLRAMELESEVDASDLSTGWYVLGAGEGNTAVFHEENHLTWGSDLLGADLWFTKLINSPEANSEAEAEAVGLAEWVADRRKVNAYRLSTDTYDIGRFASPGDTIYAYNPIDRISNADTQVVVGGRTIFPVSLRVRATTWPVVEGMGVYLRQEDATIEDISQWIEWDTGPTTFELGTAKRPLVPRGPNAAVERRLR